MKTKHAHTTHAVGRGGFALAIQALALTGNTYDITDRIKKKRSNMLAS
jgi:hypothetical protein